MNAPLFLAEVRRLFWIALIGSIVHGVVLFQFVQSELFARESERVSPLIIAYTLSAIALGVWQFGSYRARGLWAYLLHRLAPPSSLYLSIWLAGMSALLVAIALPWLVATAFVWAFTHQVVDARHLLTFAYPFLHSGVFFTIGSLLTLHGRSWHWMILTLPFLYFTNEVVGQWHLGIITTVLAVVVLFTISRFGPLATVRQGSSFLSRVVAALVLQAASFGVVVALSAVFIAGSSSLVSSMRGSAEWYSDRASPESALTEALTEVGRDVAGFEADSATQIGLGIAKYPVLDQPLLADRLPHEDDETGTIWVFAHDEMGFFGRDARSDDPVGWLGAEWQLRQDPGSIERFRSVPLLRRSNLGTFLIMPARIDSVDFADFQATTVFEVEGDERVASVPVAFGERTILRTTRRIVVGRNSRDPIALFDNPTSLPLAMPSRTLSALHAMQGEQGLVMLVLHGLDDTRGVQQTFGSVMVLAPDGNLQISEMFEVPRTTPASFRHLGLILSPAWQVLSDVAQAAIEPWQERRVRPADLAEFRPPIMVSVSAVLVAAICGFAAFLVCRSRGVHGTARTTWVLASVFAGVPALTAACALAESEDTRGDGREPDDLDAHHPTGLR